jgi:hypothetical protein
MRIILISPKLLLITLSSTKHTTLQNKTNKKITTLGIRTWFFRTRIFTFWKFPKWKFPEFFHSSNWKFSTPQHYFYRVYLMDIMDNIIVNGIALN